MCAELATPPRSPTWPGVTISDRNRERGRYPFARFRRGCVPSPVFFASWLRFLKPPVPLRDVVVPNADEGALFGIIPYFRTRDCLGVLLLILVPFSSSEIHLASVPLAAVDIFTYIVLVLFGVGVGFCIRK